MTGRFSSVFLQVASLFMVASALQSEELPMAIAAPPAVVNAGAPPSKGWSYDPDAGFVFRDGDLKWITWGYAERLIDPKGPDLFRRVRQGMELDFGRFSPHRRSAFVYEVDLTDNDFFRQGPKWKVFENLYYAFQDAEDPGKFRVVIGENTHVLAREDSLSSGNLPLINRSLILEEHGSVNSFGTQFGIQLQKEVAPDTVLALSAQDNRGSLNTDHPRFHVGNSLAGKLTRTVFKNDQGTSLNLGFGVDDTRNIKDRTYSFASAIAGEQLGGTEATGNKLTFGGHAVLTSKVSNRPYAIEEEMLHSRFDGSGTTVYGGYLQGQIAISRLITPVIRYDVVRLDRGARSVNQRAVRLGINYNVPHTRELFNVHLEYAHNRIGGPADFVTHSRSLDEFRIELRLSATRYLRF